MAKSQDIPVRSGCKSPAPANPLLGLNQQMGDTFNEFLANWTRFFENYWSEWGDLSKWNGAWRMADAGRASAWTPWHEWRLPVNPAGQVPSVDLSETDKAYEIAAELPGMDPKEIEIAVQGDTLVLKGEKKTAHGEKDRDFHITERSYGTFRRDFHLPDDADPDKIGTRFAYGVLSITLPKFAQSQAKHRKIDVGAS